MKAITILFVTGCGLSWLLIGGEVALGRKVVEYETVEEITRHIDTKKEREAAVTRLLSIIQDANENRRLRWIAALKLGDLGAVEAKTTLENLAKTLEWADSTRQLKWACELSYWKIRVVEEPNEGKQIELLKKGLGARLDGKIGGGVQDWAADELAGRGAKEALPDIIKSIRYCNPGERGEKHIWLCKTKIELLSTSKSREEGLIKALGTEDLTQEQGLTRWAIDELGKIKTNRSRDVLLGYALGLQSICYDEAGRPRDPRTCSAISNVGVSYRKTIKVLRKQGLSDADIKAAGLSPDKYFLVRD